MIHRGHANDGRSLRWTSWRRRGDVATSSTWHNFPQPLSVLWNGKLPLYCYSLFNFVGFCFFDSKVKLKLPSLFFSSRQQRPRPILHLSDAREQWLAWKRHEPRQGAGDLFLRASHRFGWQNVSQQKKVHTDWCLPHSTFVNSVEPMEATWSYHHFGIRWTYALCAFENFLGT